MKNKPIRIDWEELESAFDSGNEEILYYLDLITGQVKLEGEGDTDCTRNLSDTTPTFTLEGYYRIEIKDDNAVIADGDYWVPFYSCS